MMIDAKICDNCKHINPVNLVECEECGYDLTFVTPTVVDDSPTLESDSDSENGSGSLNSSESSDKEKDKWIMACLANEEEFVEIRTEVSVGRDCELFGSRFNSSNFTSRLHAKLRVVDGHLQVMDASTNGTFVNDKRIQKMEWVEVEEGNILKFADITFVIRRG